MKKIFRFFALAAMAASVTAFIACGDDNSEDGGEVGPETGDPILLDVNFDDGAIPETWTKIDADGDGYGWTTQTVQNGQVSWNASGSDCAVSASFINQIGELTPDNYLVSPEFYIPSAGGYNLTYQVFSTDNNDFAEHYSVYVGKLENGVFQPMGTLIEETLSTRDLQDRSASLDEFKGKNVRLAFRHHNCSNMYWLGIDNIKVSNEASKGNGVAGTVNITSMKKVK